MMIAIAVQFIYGNICADTGSGMAGVLNNATNQWIVLSPFLKEQMRIQRTIAPMYLVIQ